MARAAWQSGRRAGGCRKEDAAPKRIVAGHKDPNARDNVPSAILDSTKTYILDFERSLSESDSPQELVDKMIALHGDRTTPHSLWVSAVLVFQQERGAAA